MAIFKEMRKVRPSSSLAFDRRFKAGMDVPFSGIYGCTGCATERVFAGGGRIPVHPKADPHPPWCAGVLWQLVVACSPDTPPQ